MKRRTDHDHVKKRVQEDLDHVSGKISTLSRHIGFAMAGLSLGLALSDSIFARSMVAQHVNLILLISALGCTTILLDSCQYLSGYSSSNLALNRLKDERRSYPFQGSKLKKIRVFCFYGKQGLAILGALLVIILLAETIYLGDIAAKYEDCRPTITFASDPQQVRRCNCYFQLYACII
jgi:hypothetical protein